MTDMSRQAILERLLRNALDWLDSHPDPRAKSFVIGVRDALNGEYPGTNVRPNLCAEHGGCGKDH